MAIELEHADDVLKIKILEEINNDFRRADQIVFALMTSPLLHVLNKHCENSH